MRVLGLFLLAGMAMAQAPAYHEVAKIGQLMQGLISPASAAIRDAAKDTGPADQAAWNKAAVNAVLLQEGAELLLMGGRAKDQDGWVKAAKVLEDSGAEVEKAIAAKDVAALQAASGKIGGACQGCHSVYRQRGGAKKQ